MLSLATTASKQQQQQLLKQKQNKHAAAAEPLSVRVLPFAASVKTTSRGQTDKRQLAITPKRKCCTDRETTTDGMN